MEQDQAGGDGGAGVQHMSGPEGVGRGKSHQEEQYGQERLVEEEAAGAGPRAGGSGWWSKVEVEQHVMVG